MRGNIRSRSEYVGFIRGNRPFKNDKHKGCKTELYMKRNKEK